MSNEIIVKGNPNIRNIALTFDDGPGRITPYILDVLRKYGAKATFFSLVTVLTKVLLLRIIRADM
ncbi:polysaccharide deacetylase family protein [Methanosarcina barkeri]|uniref:polysaccharide deacetylase family protein n=1 Tax=Methanosarcina barkeri TaxID=2208 RepID=UPI000AB76F26|nr:polysaccharide deacetylase family protein [Methanosarcina barkeri]